MIILQNLSWDNCFSYGEGNSLDLTDSTLTQVLGTNGVGKSSIPLILEEVLFNKNSKGVKKADIANREVGEGYSISLTFTKDSDQYEVTVTRKASAKVTLTKNGEDISSHTATNTYKTLQEILGMEFKTFSQIVYQNTNSSLQFLTATDTNRKKFLIELLNLDNYMQYYELFKKVAKESQDALSHAAGQKSTLEKWVESNKLNDTQVQTPLEIPNSLEEERNELSSVLEKIKNISEKNSKISKNNEYIKLLHGVLIADAKVMASEAIVDVTDLQSRIGGSQAYIQKLKQSIEKMNSLGDVCHTCEQEVSNEFKTKLIEKETEELENLETELLELRNELRAITKKNSQIEKARKEVDEWTNLYRAIDQSLPTELLNETELKERADELEFQINRQNEAIRKAQKRNEQIAAHNAKVQVIKEQLNDVTSQISEVNQQIKEYQEKTANLEILKKTFSTNGLVAYKIENLVKELENLTNQYLGELSDGRFTLGFVVLNDKLNVEITDNERVVDILSLSSGELARVNTATLLAIRKLMSSISQSKINVLFLDEVINVLDEAGREKLVEILLEEELNTFLVSHNWTHPLLSKIEVKKHNKISSLESA